MFNLKKQKGTITHLNVRSEKHGEDDVLAVDVKIQADVSNEFLDELAPGLRAAIFAPEGAKVGETADIEEKHLGSLRFPQLLPLKWKAGVIAGQFVLHRPKNAGGDLEFEADVKEAWLSCKEGGTVELVFSASILPTAEQSGELTGLLNEDVRFSMAPPALSDSPPTNEC